MKTLEDFLRDVDINEQLKVSLEDTESVAELCDKAKKHGYDFTEDELTEYYLDAVSGGFGDVDKSSYGGSLSQTIEGDHNVQINYGDVTVSGGDVSKEDSAPLTVDQKMQIVYWALNRKN